MVLHLQLFADDRTSSI